MTIRVGIDYTAAAWQGAGIGRYTRELVHTLIAQSDAYSYTLFLPVAESIRIARTSPISTGCAMLITMFVSRRYRFRRAA